ncbi:MAG: peptidoglycan-binding domain-containing protein [Pseudomonadota bacterium]
MPFSVNAADDEGNYAIRGAGAQTCQAMVEQLEETPELLNAYASWMEGYLTGYNRFLDDTFDVSPVMSAREVAVMVRNICRDSADIRVETALARLINLFMPARVQAASNPVTLSVGDSTLNIRQATLQRLQQALIDRGYEDVEANGRFNDATREAVSDFQEQQGLNATGAPDVDTLVRLLFTETE